MKAKLGHLFASREALGLLVSIPLDGAKAYKLLKQVNKANYDIEIITRLKDELVMRFGDATESGYLVSEENREEFLYRLSELLNSDSEEEYEKIEIELEKLSRLEISAQALGVLQEWLLDIKE